jgi:hypothetical protein
MPAKNQISVYVGPPLARFIGPMGTCYGGPTAAVNALAERYGRLLDAAGLPDWSPAEWEAVCRANAVVWGDGRGIPDLRPVSDDLGAVNRVLAGLSAAGKFAVIEAVERFWADQSGRPARAVLEQILAG